MSKKVDDALRAKWVKLVEDFLKDAGEEVLRTDTGKIAIPTIDGDGNDAYVEFTIKIPKGSRDGEAYDAYNEAESYAMHIKEKEEKKAEAAKIKAEKIEKDKKLREARAEAKRKAKEEK